MKAPVLGINRHRILTDGDGITTLVAFYGCPLDCRYCVNPQCKHIPNPEDYYTPESLLDAVAADNLYYRATNGGVTFGGGEPALQSRFIAEFRRICPPEWNITLESSLNVPCEHIERLLPVVDSWIVDVRDWNDAIYTAYAGRSNAQAIENLSRLLTCKGPDCVTVRVPSIAGYNTSTDTAKTVAELRRMGVSNVDEFAYRTEGVAKSDDEIKTGVIGKGTCELLRAVRVQVAREAGIDYEPVNCTHEVCATGSCPACEAEAAELSRQVFEGRGAVCVDGIVSRQQLSRPSKPQKCDPKAHASSVSSADSDTSAPGEDWRDTILSGRLRRRGFLDKLLDKVRRLLVQEDDDERDEWLTGDLRPLGQDEEGECEGERN